MHRCRRALGVGVVVIVATCGFAAAPSRPAGAATSSRQQATAIVSIARKALVDDHLNAVILKVTVNGKPLVTKAMGTSMVGVPATTRMHFRNGAVAISYMSTLLLEFVDEHKINLDDHVSTWFPNLPDADQVTIKMLANMTSGYADYVTGPMP
jgi:CubicO group peptidase (beta-lactamase class C family)